MKKLGIAILVAIATIGTSFAQSTSAKPQASKQTQASKKTLPQKADELTAGMTKNLGLTPEQAKKVREINLFSLQSVEEARAQYKGEHRKVLEQIDIISQTRLSRLKDVLTPQQFAQYQQRREEKMGVPKQLQTNPANRQPGSAYEQSY